MEFLKKNGERLVLTLPLFWLSIDWLIDGHIIAFILTAIFVFVVIGWSDE